MPDAFAADALLGISTPFMLICRLLLRAEVREMRSSIANLALRFEAMAIPMPAAAPQHRLAVEIHRDDRVLYNSPLKRAARPKNIASVKQLIHPSISARLDMALLGATLGRIRAVEGHAERRSVQEEHAEGQELASAFIGHDGGTGDHA